jgi:hypothetical protein
MLQTVGVGMNRKSFFYSIAQMLTALGLSTSSVVAQITPAETCNKAAAQLIGQTVVGAYLDTFALTDTDAGAILQLGTLTGGASSQRDLGPIGGLLQLDPNNPRFSLALRTIVRSVPIQHHGLQTTCRITGMTEGQIQIRMTRTQKDVRAAEGVVVTMTIEAAGSSSGVEVLKGDQLGAFQEAASQFEKALRPTLAQAAPLAQSSQPTTNTSPAPRTVEEVPKLGQVTPSVPQLPPPSISPPPPPRIGAQTSASTQTPSDFPLKDGRYLPVRNQCVASEEEFEGMLVSGGGQELLVEHDMSCKRISYGPNPNGIGIVWKCADERTRTIYQTVRPEGRFSHVSQWINELRGQPNSVETFEHCPNPKFREQRGNEGSRPTAQPAPTTEARYSHSFWRIEHDRKNDKISLLSDTNQASVVCHLNSPNVEFFFPHAPVTKVDLSVSTSPDQRQLPFRRFSNASGIRFQLIKNDPAIRWIQETSIEISSFMRRDSYVFGNVGRILRDVCAASFRGPLAATEDPDAALWGDQTPKWVELIRGATLRPTSNVLRLCRDVASKHNFPRDHVVAHVRACFIRETEPRFLDQGLKALQRDIIACRPRVGPLDPDKFNECLDRKLTAELASEPGPIPARTPVHPERQASLTPTRPPVLCPFNGTWRIQVEASCTRFRSTAIVENCKIVRGGHLRGASGSIDPATGAVTYRVAASSDEGTPGGSGTGTLRRDQSGNGRITLGPGCEGTMRWWRE